MTRNKLVGKTKPSEEAGGPAKKPKTVVACKNCGAKPNGASAVEWSAYINVKGAKTPSGDACLMCHQLWHRGFLYLPWQEFAAWQTEDPWVVKTRKNILRNWEFGWGLSGPTWFGRMGDVREHMAT